MMTMFRQLRDDEFDEAYAIASDAVSWLLSKGITQYLQPIPEKAYRKRHLAGWNHGLFIQDKLAAVITLIKGYRPAEWQGYLPEDPFIWMATLASAHACKGLGVGGLAVAHAENLLRQHGERLVLLDCYYGTGFLPHYYANLGYVPIKRMEVVYPSRTIDALLMSKIL